MTAPPSEIQLCPIPEDLDGQQVVKHLLGKDVPGAVRLLEENSLYYQEDYSWMGPEAFCYYADALVSYLESPAANNDVGFAYGMLHTFRHRLDTDGNAVRPAYLQIKKFCEIVRRDCERLGFDDDYQKRAANRTREIEERLHDA